LYKLNDQPTYREQIHLSLSLLSAYKQTEIRALEKRNKELKKQLELANIMTVDLNTMIDIATQNYKLEIRKNL